MNGDRNSDASSVPQTFSGLRQWRNTSVATLPVGGSATFPVGTLGYEWNEDKDNGFRPPGDVRLSSTTVNLGQGTYLIRDFGSTYTSGTAIHSMTLYKAPSGARVFNSGTVQWSWGIDPLHATPSTDMMQATVNILADLGAQPATLQAGLVAADRVDGHRRTERHDHVTERRGDHQHACGRHHHRHRERLGWGSRGGRRGLDGWQHLAPRPGNQARGATPGCRERSAT